MRSREAEKKEHLFKTFPTDAICPKCGRRLETSDIPDYSLLCKNCDENFFVVEALSEETLTVTIPQNKVRTNASSRITQWIKSHPYIKKVAKTYTADTADMEITICPSETHSEEWLSDMQKILK